MTTATLTKPNTVLIVAAIGLLVTGGLALSGLMVKGHAALNTSSVGMYWGLPIVVYDLFLLTSTGLAMVASLALASGGIATRPAASGASAVRAASRRKASIAIESK